MDDVVRSCCMSSDKRRCSFSMSAASAVNCFAAEPRSNEVCDVIRRPSSTLARP